ncbi:MAG: amino acid adenylation domain-containing protein [Planctomycetota bacterium]
MSSIQNQDASSTATSFVVGPQTDVQNRYRATEAQLEVWLSSQQSVEANCAYNEISSLIFNGEVDVEKLERAITSVVERNAALRSTFSRDGQEVLVHQQPRFEFSVLDWSNDQDIDLESAKREVIQDQACKPFDLVNGPLLRIVVQKVSNLETRLTFTAHHVVLDGWSLSVFCRDLGYFYDQLCGIEREPLPLAQSYDQYSEKMAAYFDSEQGRADEEFWVNCFADSIPVLDLPVERNRPPVRTYYGRRYDQHFSADLVEKIRRIGAKSGCSLFNTMLAAFNAYVARISGNDDFCIGIPTAGQAAMDNPELIGHCVNTIPLRTQVDTALPFVDYMKSTRSTLLDGFEHQRYSYGTLLRKLAPPRDPARPPMLSVSFNIDPVIDTSDMGFDGLEVDVVVEPRSFENFEWFINGVILKDKSIELQVQYNSDLYSTQSMAFYFRGFAAFLEAITATPDAKISELPLMNIAQRKKVMVDWNSTELEYPANSTLHAEFSRQAESTPEKTCVVFGENELTYGEVEARSNQIARHLQSQGVNQGDLVGICVNRSEQMLVYLYAILKSGAGYVPLDPAYPSDRLQYMCDHSELKLIVTESELSDRVAGFNKPSIAIDSAAVEIDALDAGSFGVETSPENTCYVIYTSGSTGKPKGVRVPHGPVVNFLYAMKEIPGFEQDDSVLAVTTLSFDIAVLELYLPTISGGRTVVADSKTAADGAALARFIEDHDISHMQATPATWRLMIQSDWSGREDLKVLCGGEPMPQDLVAPLLDRCGELWNMYGPTETTVWSAAFRIKDAKAPIMIGKPVGNTQIYILDSNGNEVPIGCEGEVFIGGAGVTHGYLHQPEMTDKRFVRNRYRSPFVDYVSDRLYKTGDLARWCFDGNIRFLRRNDKQVKVRGFRIELGEIEQNLKSHPAVEQNVVIVREDTPGDARLVAYLVTENGDPVPASELRDHLRESVPYYMVPQHFVELETMPQTNNGKIDYKALPVPQTEPAADQVKVAESAAERFLVGVWSDVLELDEVSIDDNFFDIGGHSLLVMQVITTTEEKTGIKLGPQDFLIGTLQQIAGKLNESYAFEDDSGEQVHEESEPEVQPAQEEEVVPEENLVNPEPEVEPEAAAKSAGGLLRTLKGFWN